MSTNGTHRALLKIIFRTFWLGGSDWHQINGTHLELLNIFFQYILARIGVRDVVRGENRVCMSDVRTGVRQVQVQARELSAKSLV